MEREYYDLDSTIVAPNIATPTQTILRTSSKTYDDFHPFSLATWSCSTGHGIFCKSRVEDRESDVAEHGVTVPAAPHLNEAWPLMESGVPGMLGLDLRGRLGTDNLLNPSELPLSAKLANDRLSILPFLVIGNWSIARYWLGTA